MNKRYITLIIIACIVVIGLIVAWFAFQYYGSFKKVTFNVHQQDITADVYRRNPNADESTDDTKVGTITDKQTLSLQAAKYYAVPQGTKYDNSQISFEVTDKDMTVDVDPAYSEAYLAEKLKGELSAIQAALTAKYPIITTDFKLNDGKLYKDGSWYGTTLIKNALPGNNGDVYRVVLHKVNNVWQVVAMPQIVLTAPQNPNIPEEILSDLNAQTGY